MKCKNSFQLPFLPALSIVMRGKPWPHWSQQNFCYCQSQDQAFSLFLLIIHSSEWHYAYFGSGFAFSIKVKKWCKIKTDLENVTSSDIRIRLIERKLHHVYVIQQWVPILASYPKLLFHELFIRILLQKEEDIMKTFVFMQRKAAFTKMAETGPEGS